MDGGERLAHGAHLGKLVAEVGAEGTRRAWAPFSLSPLLRQETLRVRQFGQSWDRGRAQGYRARAEAGQAGSTPGRMEGKWALSTEAGHGPWGVLGSQEPTASPRGSGA